MVPDESISREMSFSGSFQVNALFLIRNFLLNLL